MSIEEIVRFVESHAAMCEAHGFEEEEVKALQLTSKLLRAGQAMRDNICQDCVRLADGVEAWDAATTKD